MTIPGVCHRESPGKVDLYSVSATPLLESHGGMSNGKTSVSDINILLLFSELLLGDMGLIVAD